MQIDSQTLLRNIKQTFDEAVALIERKNADYASQDDPFRNLRAVTAIGLSPEMGVLVRLTDKFSRIRSLLDKPPDVADESLGDSILDAINYLALLRELVRNRR